MNHKEWLSWMRPGIKIYYKGIDITDRVGLCVCKDCIQNVKNEIDIEEAK